MERVDEKFLINTDTDEEEVKKTEAIGSCDLRGTEMEMEMEERRSKFKRKFLETSETFQMKVVKLTRRCKYRGL